MDIVGALDLHRRQITYRWDDVHTGEIKRGQIMPGDREAVRAWLSQFEGRDVHLALEATTGWRFVVEEMHAVGVTAHLAEPTETHSKRGRKRRAKTDRADCEHLLKLLKTAELPESWIPPAHVLEWRALVRLRRTLVDERTAWRQRLRAQLFHHGAPAGIKLGTAEGRARLDGLELAPSARHVIATGLSVIDHLGLQLRPLERQLGCIARRQPGCRALQAELYGVGQAVALAIVTELGDCRRFSRSLQAVRHAGLDVTVHSSDLKRAPGHLSHQGPEVLRWMLFEAAQCAARRASPDYGYFIAARERLGYEQACLCVARKLARRAYHILRRLGADAIAPVEDGSLRQPRSSAPPEMTAVRRSPTKKMASGWLLNLAVAAAPPWTTWIERAAATSRRGATPHRSSCDRALAGPRTQISLGARACATAVVRRFRGMVIAMI